MRPTAKERERVDRGTGRPVELDLCDVCPCDCAIATSDPPWAMVKCARFDVAAEHHAAPVLPAAAPVFSEYEKELKELKERIVQLEKELTVAELRAWASEALAGIPNAGAGLERAKAYRADHGSR